MRTIKLNVYTIAELSADAQNCAYNLVVDIMDREKVTKEQIQAAHIEFCVTGALYSDEDYVYHKLSK